MAPRKRKPPRSAGASRGHLSGGQAQSRRNKNKHRGPRTSFAGGKRPADYAAYEKEEATPEYMQRLFAKHEFAVSERELERFWQYYCLLRDRNAELDLTRIMGIEATVLKHFIDSAIVADLVELHGPLVDIGSGPGFPGGPIAIRKPDLPVILAESRGKRVQFLEELRRDLNLANVTLFPRSVREDSSFVPCTESIALPLADDALPLPVHSIISRALEVIPATLRRVQPFVPTGGRVLFMKGPNCGQEVTDAQQEFKGVYKMVEDIRYDLPATRQHRRLVVFEKRE